MREVIICTISYGISELRRKKWLWLWIHVRVAMRIMNIDSALYKLYNHNTLIATITCFFFLKEFVFDGKFGSSANFLGDTTIPTLGNWIIMVITIFDRNISYRDFVWTYLTLVFCTYIGMSNCYGNIIYKLILDI